MKKKKRRGRKILISLIFLIAAFKVGQGLVSYFQGNTSTQTQSGAVQRDYSMKSNGIANLKVIDISGSTKVTDWKLVKSSVSGIYIKATEGVNYINPKFRLHAGGAIYSQIPTGFYHYFWPHGNTEFSRQQADYFYSAIKNFKYRLYPVLDIEEANGVSPDAICNDIIAFADEFKKLSGHNLMIYTNPDYANTYLLDDRLSNYPLWVANYKVSAPITTSVWNTYYMWQRSDQYFIPGIDTKVDEDIATKSIFMY
jgi:GH25 family lysozyme M1 (1,4-beta-N-acetylmuramidase)